MTCGEWLVELLESYGVELVFGIPGVHTVELYRGLPATRIRHITPRHEQGAGFMADGYARVSGRPGVCFIITGPGMTNIATAMAQAYGDSIPMLVISSVNRSDQLGLGGGRLHELTSQRQLTAPLTAFSHTLLRPAELPEILARAFAVFGASRPRPVHLEMPLDVITAPVEPGVRRRPGIPHRPGPAPQDLALAVEALAAARRPVLLLGGGSIGAAAEATALAERLEAPTAVTINAKGVLPPGHPLLLGSNATFPAVRELIAEADVVLAVGTELGETDYDLFADEGLRIPGRLVRIDIDPEQVHRNFRADVALVGDARLALQALLTGLGARRPGEAGEAAREARARVAQARRRLLAEWPASWAPQRRTLELVQQTLPGVIIVGDSTQPVYSGNHCYEAQQPRTWFNSATGYGTLGYALPAAIGARLAAPDRPVVALVGDGGLQFTLAELASAVEARTPVIVLLWNNQGYGEIKRYMQGRGITPIGVDIHTPDFVTLARGFGLRAERARSFEELRARLIEAASAAVPSLIEVREEGEFAA